MAAGRRLALKPQPPASRNWAAPLDTIKGGVFGGAGRGTYWIGPNLSIQLDVQAEGTSYDNPSIVSLSSTSNFSALD